MADWLPHVEWLSCPTPAIAAAVAARLASIDRFSWPDDRWAARVARIGRGALYQVEGVDARLSPPRGDQCVRGGSVGRRTHLTCSRT
jgi:hypothetical protein